MIIRISLLITGVFASIGALAAQSPMEPKLVMPVEPAPAISTTPGDGATISMLNGSSRLKIFGSFSAISQFATDRPFPSGGTLFILPPPASGRSTNTFDLHARQSSIGASYSGPAIGEWTPGATFLGFIQNDNLTSDAYGFLPFNAYGELKNDQWRFAAGLQNDVFNPLKPTMISLLNLFASGNTGSFRGQLRAEHILQPSEAFQVTSQFALGDPVASVLSNNRLIEDDGWPQIEGRVMAGLGERLPAMGGRNVRLIEVGVSGQVGALRSVDVVGGNVLPPRSTISVWGVGVDAQAALTERFGVSGEFFTGQGLGEASGGIGQSFGRDLRAVRTTGGWGEAYVYITDDLHLHAGYGIDTARRGDLAPSQIARNRTLFSNLIWDVSKNLQFSFEVDFRRTDYVTLQDASSVLFISQMLWKF